VDAASSQYFSLADNASVSTGDIDFTWACWVNPRDITTTVFVDKTDEYQLGVDGSSNFYFKGGAGGSDTATETGVTAAVGSWYFVSGGYDKTNYWVKVNDNARTEDAAGAAPADTANALALMSSTGGGSYWDGAADHCIMWKESKTDNQLDVIYADGF